MAELKIPQKTLQDNFNLQDFKDDFNALNSEIEENKTLTDSEISRLKEIANTWESFRDNGGVINSEVKLPSISLIKNAKKHFTMNVENDGSNNHFAIHSYNENGNWLQQVLRIYFNGTVSIFNQLNLQSSNKNTNGYTYLPNGLIMQWGKSTSWAGGKLWIEYPISFPSNVVNVSITSLENVNSGCKTIFSTPDVSNVGFNAVSNVNQIGFFWIAIGY